jgi:hypothetical protein
LNTSIETTELYKVAFFLCMGGNLIDVRIRNSGTSRLASFLVAGNELDKQDKIYRSGKALVNPLEFRESINHLRDILYETLKKNKIGIRYDRTRKNRKYKKKY